MNTIEVNEELEGNETTRWSEKLGRWIEDDREEQEQVEPNPDPYQTGAILESSWGYDQTNIDYFKIVKRTNDTVFLLPLKSKTIESGDMRGTCEPGEPYTAGEYISCIGTWNGKPIRRKLARYRESINTPAQHVGKVFGCSIEHGWCSIWDGKPSHFTSYA